MTQIGYICKNCNASILEEAATLKLLKDAEIMHNNELIKEHNKLVELEYEEQKKELKEIGIKLKQLYDTKLFKKRYDFECDDKRVSLWNDDWYTFTDKEAENFKPKTGLYVSKKKDGRLQAYFTLSYIKKWLSEHRYLLCPLCNTKSYLPLQSMILK